MKKLLIWGFCGALAMTAQAVRTVSVESVRGAWATVQFGPAANGETNALTMAWGDADGGTDATRWAHHRFVALVRPGEAAKKVPLPEGWGGAGATKLRFFLSDGCEPDDYATDGLLNRWDAIDNAGTGVHDAHATDWKDLAGDLDLALTTNGQWSAAGNALVVNGAAAYAAGPAASYVTIELLCGGTHPVTNGQIVFSPGVGEKSDTQTTRIVVNHLGKLQLNAGKSDGVAFPTDGSVRAFSGLYDFNVATTFYIDGMEERDVYFFSETWQRGDGFVIVGDREKDVARYPWKGEMYSIRLYDRKLTAAEIANNHLRDMVRFFGFPSRATETVATETVTCAPAVIAEQTIYDGKGAPTAFKVGFAGMTGPAELVMAWDAADKGETLSAWANQKLVAVISPDTETRAFAVPSGWGNAAKAARFFLLDGFSVPSSYVKSGLIVSWDGIDNAGTGTHDPAATVWKDLAGSHDLTLTNSAAWNAAGNGLNVSGFSAYNENKTPAFRTIEAIYTPSDLIGSVLLFSGNSVKSDTATNSRRDIFFDNLGQVAYADGSQETRYANAPAKSGVTASFAATCSADGTVSTVSANGETTDAGCHKNYWGCPHGHTMLGNRQASSDYPWFGQVHAIRMYSRELSAAERLDNYRCDLARYMGATPKASTAVAAVSGVFAYSGTKQEGDPTVTVTSTPLADSGLFRVDLRTGTREVIRNREFLPLTWSSENGGAALDYVKRGLIAHWDGIDNAGTGVHNATAEVWKDKVGSLDMTLLPGGSWNALGNAIVCDGPAAQGPAAAPAYRTIETTYKMTSSGGRIMFTSGMATRFVLFDGSGTKEYYDGAKDTVSATRTFDANAMRSSVAIYNESNVVTRIFHEGAQVKTSAQKNTWGVGDGKVMVGNRSAEKSDDARYKWYGEIYSIRLYDRELTDEEVAHNRLIDLIRFSGNPVMAILPEDLVARVKLVRLEGEGDDLTQWAPVPSSEKTLVQDKGEGTINWLAEKGAWKLTLEILYGDTVLQMQASLFDLRNLKPGGMLLILR